MTWPYPPLPPDNRSVGSGSPAADMNQVVDYLSALTARVGKARYDPRDYGAVGDGVTDDLAKINACIADTPVDGAVVDLGMAPVSYAISGPIAVKTGCTLTGSFVNGSGASPKLDVTTLGTFSGVAAIADAKALNTTDTTPSSSFPLSVFGVSIDLTNCPGTTDGFRFMAFGCWVYHCATKRAPGCGIRFTDANAGGFAITNTAVENRVCECTFSKSGISGIKVENFTQALTDGYCLDNIIQCRSTVTGDATNSTGPGVDFEYSANWQIRSNHVYACPLDAYVIKNGFGTFFVNNDADNFGLAGAASTTYHGLSMVTILAGPASSIIGNDIQCNEGGAASTVYQYYNVTASSGASPAAWVNMIGNTARQQSSGPGTSTARAFAGGGGTLNVTELGTAIVSPTTSPTISAVNTFSGTVNLLHPGATALNSGSVTVPLGVSSTYGAVTTLLLPLLAGSGMTVPGIQIVWGGTFATDTVNAQFVATWDDGTTSTYTSATATATSTVNIVTASTSPLYKQGRQMVKLTAQARTTLGSTTVTCAVTAMGTAA